MIHVTSYLGTEVADWGYRYSMCFINSISLDKDAKSFSAKNVMTK